MSQESERRWKNGLDYFSLPKTSPRNKTKFQTVICENPFAVLEPHLLCFKWHERGT